VNTPPPPPRISRDTIEAALDQDDLRRRAAAGDLAAVARLYAEGLYQPPPPTPRTRDHTP
jgi:hypothetical protein